MEGVYESETASLKHNARSGFLVIWNEQNWAGGTHGIMTKFCMYYSSIGVEILT